MTYKVLNRGKPVHLRKLIHPYFSSRNTRRSSPKLKFLQTPTFDRNVHKSNISQILSVIMPQFYGTLSPLKQEIVPVFHLSGNISKLTFSSSFPTVFHQILACFTGPMYLIHIFLTYLQTNYYLLIICVLIVGHKLL